MPIIEYFDSLNLVKRIDASKNVDEVTNLNKLISFKKFSVQYYFLLGV